MRKTLVAVLLLTLAACESSTEPEELGEPWVVSGLGNDVLDRPASVGRVRITGAYSGEGSNFIVWCGTDLLVNEIIGTRYESTTYAGTHQVEPGCNPIKIENSTGVAWSLTEVR